MDALGKATPISSLTHIVITHIDPNRIASLEAVLTRVAAGGNKPTVICTNPASKVLQTSLGGWRGRGQRLQGPVQGSSGAAGGDLAGGAEGAPTQRGKAY